MAYEAAWAMTNLAGGEIRHCASLLAAGCHKTLIRLVRANGKVAEQALWALGNVTATSLEARDEVLENGIVDKLLEILERPVATGTVLEHVCWIISNVWKGEPGPEAKFVCVETT